MFESQKYRQKNQIKKFDQRPTNTGGIGRIRYSSNMQLLVMSIRDAPQLDPQIDLELDRRAKVYPL